MTILSDFREKYPQYDDMSDIALAEAMHRKFYSDMPEHEFAVKIGLVTQEEADKVMANMGHVGAKSDAPTGVSGQVQEALTGTGSDVVQSAASGFRSGVESLPGAMGDIADINGRGAGWAASKLGASPETAGMVREGVDALSGGTIFPSSREIGGATDAAVSALPGGEDIQSVTRHTPQTTLGEYAKTGASFVPAALGGPGNIGRRVLTQAIVPALGSETAGQLTKGTAYEPYARVAGALLAPLSAAGAKRALTPFPASAERIAAADVLAKEGVDITAGQRTGNKTLRLVEEELGGGALQNVSERQGRQFTKATLKRAGIDSDVASPEVMNNAFDRIGADFDNLAARNELVPDAKFANDLTTDLKGYKELTGADAKPIVEETITNIVQDIAGNGKLTGERYQEMRSKLDKAARATIGTDPTLSASLRDIRTTLDDAMERSISATNPKDAGLWKKARREYRNILVIEKAASAPGENARMGIISPKALRAATIQVQRRRAFVRGQGDFHGLASAGEAVMSPLGNSNTAGRAAARGLGSTLAGAIVGTGIPGIGTLTGAAAGMIAPAALGRAILSKPGRAFLGNQANQGTPLRALGKDAFIAGLMGGQQIGQSLGSGRPLELTVTKHNRPANAE